MEAAPKRKNNVLVVYCLYYPFGTGEAFLHTEIKILARYFDRIYVLPSHRSGAAARELPANVQAIGPLGHGTGTASHRARRGRLVSTFLWTSMFSRDRWKHLRGWQEMQTQANMDLGRLDRIASIIDQEGLQDAVHYDYWMLNSTLSLAWLKQLQRIHKLVCRAHGFDLYDERHALCLPFRDYRMRHIDAVATISEHGEHYLRRRWAGAQQKVHRYPLGICLEHTDLGPPPDPNEVPVIVSCSRIHPVKRLEKIVEALRHIGQRLHWIHIGDGPGRSELEQDSRSLPPNITSEFRGDVSNEAVFRFYRQQPVRALVNVSSMEGLPVTMMEAGAFGVPVVAADVGGVSEIVTPCSGVLFEADSGAQTIAGAIEEAVFEQSWDRGAIRARVLSRFDAQKNFARFAEFLLRL